MSQPQFTIGEYYHIYNRGVDKRNVFMNEKDFMRFLTCMDEFNVMEPIGSLFKLKRKTSTVSGRHRTSQTSQVSSQRFKLVEFISYCLNPNHFHFILKQLIKSGISEFMKRLGDGYTKYFNYKYIRSGSLFQGRFKAVHVDSDEYFLWLSAYVNGNAQIHDVIKEAKKYPWCSYPDYLGLRNGNLCDKDIILGQFKNLNEYEKFVEESIPAMKERKDLPRYLME
jgi:putative transposase